MEIAAIVEQVASGIGYFVAGVYLFIAILFLFVRMGKMFGLRFEEGGDGGLKGFLKNFR